MGVKEAVGKKVYIVGLGNRINKQVKCFFFLINAL